MPKKYKITDEDRTIFRETVGKIRQIVRPQAKEEEIETTRYLSDSGMTETVESEETLSFSRHDLPNLRFRQLRQGKIPIKARLDLHGSTIDEAREILIEFIHHSVKQRHTCVLIIHGKGRTDPKNPRLKNHVNQWLRQFKEVLAFCSAKPYDGGAGAVYVLIRGKVHAE